MNKIIKYIKRLNWYGGGIIFFLSMIAAFTNENVETLFDCFMLGIIFGVPFGLLFLFIGIREE